MYLGLGHTNYIKRSKVKFTAGKMTQKHCEHHISQMNKGNFTQFWSQMYLGS